RIWHESYCKQRFLRYFWTPCSHNLPFATICNCRLGQPFDPPKAATTRHVGPNSIQATLGTRLWGSRPSSHLPSSEDLDNPAEVLAQIIHDAYCGATKRTLGAGHGNPWSNYSCEKARKSYKLALWSLSTESGICDARKC
ncbi:BgTH12-00442, partial [Blumeria graminis f. sp. triticale]